MDKQTAVLLMYCVDQRGILADVTNFIMGNNGNIINLDQHVDEDDQLFFMRIEWELKDFIIPFDKIEEYFQTMIVQKYDATYELHYQPQIPNVALFVSKYSHCFLDILSRHEAGEWNINIPCIISNHEKFADLSARFNIPFFHFPVKKDNKAQLEKQ